MRDCRSAAQRPFPLPDTKRLADPNLCLYTSAANQCGYCLIWATPSAEETDHTDLLDARVRDFYWLPNYLPSVNRVIAGVLHLFPAAGSLIILPHPKRTILECRRADLQPRVQNLGMFHPGYQAFSPSRLCLHTAPKS